MSDYARPDALVSTQWVADHLNDPNVRIVESNEDILLYDTGHIPQAIKIDWFGELNDPVIRDYLDAERFAQLLSEKGIGPDHTVVFYGDKNNWWAAYAFWVFQLFGHTNAKIMNGGRQKWIEEGRSLTKEKPNYPPVEYPAPTRDDSQIRAFRDDVRRHLQAGGMLVDVRSPEEYAAFHIAGAVNVPLPGLIDYLAPYQNRGRIVLYSNGMTHPAQARDALARLGYENVFMLTDGLRGFLDRCLMPVSLRREPLSEAESARVRAWRAFFLSGGAP